LLLAQNNPRRSQNSAVRFTKGMGITPNHNENP
jgi:hypothetical protein